MSEGRILESWKAIASYLGHTARTCRKWELELGLPIHRLEHSPRAHVFAYTDELDRWKSEKLRTLDPGKVRWFSGLERKTRFRLMAVSALFFLVIIGLLIRLITKHPLAPAGQAVKGVAVLPFTDLSPAKDYEYLCDGLVEVLINSLSGIAGLRVPARTSAFYFKGQGTPLGEIRKKLRVEYVLEGSVQVEGDRLRVIPRLLSADDGVLIWSEKYDGSRDDILATQDDIAREVVRALNIKILEDNDRPLVKAYTKNREAYELYLKGRYFWEKRGKENLYKAIEYYRQALDIDPVFALPHAGMALSYYVLASNFHIPPREAYPKAKAALRRAFEIENNLAEAYVIRAALRMDADYDFALAEEDFRTAIKINPDNATAHHWYACLLNFRGRHDEAIAEVKLARDLDPLAPVIAACVGRVLYFARRYDEALAELKKAIELDANYSLTYHIAGTVYAAQGLYDKAVSSHQKCIDLSSAGPGINIYAELSTAYAYGVSGKKEKARSALDKVMAQSRDIYVNPCLVAIVYCGLGENDQALAWLERGFDERAIEMVALKVQPIFDPLRSDPRFQDLLRRIGLEN